MTRQSRELSRGGLETKIKVDRRRNGLDHRCLRNEPALRLRPQVLARCDVILFIHFLVVAIFQAVMVYRASTLRGLAITQMVFAALMITFGAACIFSVDHWSSKVGFGIWVGSWVCMTIMLIIILTFYVIKHYWYHVSASLR